MTMSITPIEQSASYRQRIRLYGAVMFKSKFLASLGLAFTAAGLILPVNASALSLGYRTQSVLLHIPAKDVDNFKSFIFQTLDTGEAGQQKEWNSSARGSKLPVKVLITPSPVVDTQSAGRCRMLSTNVSLRRQTETWQVWFCQQKNGNWKISGLN